MEETSLCVGFPMRIKMTRSGYIWREIQRHNVQPVTMRRYLYGSSRATPSLQVLWDLNHSGVDTENWVKLTILDALAPSVGRPAVAMVLTRQDMPVLVFNGQRVQLHSPWQCQGKIENANISMCILNIIHQVSDMLDGQLLTPGQL